MKLEEWIKEKEETINVIGDGIPWSEQSKLVAIAHILLKAVRSIEIYDEVDPCELPIVECEKIISDE